MKIAVLCSGGVDSSLALYLLKEQGYDLTAFYLKIWLEDELADLGSCPWQEDAEYVEKTCKMLGVPWRIIPFQQEYQKQIIQYLIAEVKQGRTPNPDLLCNNRIKFGAFWEELKKAAPHCEKIATGHYANLRLRGNFYELLSSSDPIKDQTYFLSHLDQSQLGRCLFPLGPHTKKAVRSLAKKFNLPAAARKDSQGLCFLGKINFSDFLRRHFGEKPGPLLEYESGKKLGEHSGFWFYTIGQRQGLGLSKGPWYVAAKDQKKNHVYISRQYHILEKSRGYFFAKDLHWISGSHPQNLDTKEIRVKLRHGPSSYSCRIKMLKGDAVFVKIEGSDQGIAPGQFAVFYEKEVCLGCGMISEPPQYLSQYTSSLPEYDYRSFEKSGVSLRA